jgi:hypothetical protein
MGVGLRIEGLDLPAPLRAGIFRDVEGVLVHDAGGGSIAFGTEKTFITVLIDNIRGVLLDVWEGVRFPVLERVEFLAEEDSAVLGGNSYREREMDRRIIYRSVSMSIPDVI